MKNLCKPQADTRWVALQLLLIIVTGRDGTGPWTKQFLKSSYEDNKSSFLCQGFHSQGKQKSMPPTKWQWKCIRRTISTANIPFRYRVGSFPSKTNFVINFMHKCNNKAIKVKLYLLTSLPKARDCASVWLSWEFMMKSHVENNSPVRSLIDNFLDVIFLWSSLTVDHRISDQNMGHAVSVRSQRQSEGAQEWPDDRHFPVGEFFEQRTNEKSWEIHHDVQKADDESCTGGADVQVFQQITEEKPERRFNASCC